MPTSGAYNAGKRAAVAGKPRTVPPKWARGGPDWLRGFDTTGFGVKPDDTAPESAPPLGGASVPETPPIAAPALQGGDAPAPAGGDPGPGTPGPDAQREAADAVAAAGIPQAVGPDGAQPESGATGGTCYKHGLGALRCVAVENGAQCERAVVRPMRQVAADRIARRTLALVATAASVIADVPDPGVEDSEAEGVGAGIHAASERMPWLNENVGDLALGGLSLVGFSMRMAVDIRRARKKGKRRGDDEREKEEGLPE